MKKPEKKECDCEEQDYLFNGCTCGCGSFNQACDEWEKYHEEQIKEIREEQQRQIISLQHYWEGQAQRLLNGLKF